MSQPPALRRVLGLRDIVLFNIVAVVGLRWIPRSARLGPEAVTLWMLAWLLFFLPLAAAVIELSTRYPEQGGLYAWVRRAFGPFHAALCAWCLWVNNLFYFPSLLLFAAANVAALSEGGAQLAEQRGFSTPVVLGCLWFTVWLNIRGFAAGRALQWLGGVGTWLPAALLIGAGTTAAIMFGPATSFAPRELVPRADLLATLSLWSAFCFAFSGFEISSFAGQEVKDPERTIPRGVTIAGAMVTVIYIAGTLALLAAVPADALIERSGITDAVDLVASRVGMPAFGALTAILLAVAAVAGTYAWAAGAARVSFAAGMDRLWPATMARLHPRHGTPYVALIVQGIISSAIFLTSLFLTVGGGTTSVQDAYDILVNVTIAIYFVPYLYLFIALVRLRRQRPVGDASKSVILVPGGRIGLWSMALAGLFATGVSLALVLVPPEGTVNARNYLVNLIGQTLAVMAAGVGLYLWSRRR